jgi:peptide/nickel transport system substrate-binding protein
MDVMRWLVWLILPLVAGCSGGGSPGAPAHQRASAAARTNEVVIAVQADARTLDPHMATDAASMRFVENMYSGLLRYADAYGELEPDLATAWTVSDDGLVYAFTLRTNAFFHGSGRPVTAADVVYSLDRIRREGARASVFAPVRSITAPDEHAVTVTLHTPLAALPAHLAHPMSAIVDREVVEGTGLERHAGGCGPFRLVEWKRQQHLRLSANPAYALPGRPRVAALTYRPIPDETARTTALRNGEVDILLDVAGKDIERLREVPGIVVESQPGTFWEYLGLNCTRPPFDDVRVRQAVAWAVDRALLNQLVKFGRATVLDGGPIPPNHWAYAGLSVYPRPDPDQARTLLAAAGLGEGADVELIVGSDFPYQVKAAEAIKQMLRPLNLRVTVRALESGAFFDRLGRKEFDLTVVGWLGFVDPDEWLGLLFRSGAEWNQQGYGNPEVDALIEQGRATRDRAERTEIYRRAQAVIAGEAPMVFLYVNERTSARLADVTGFVNHPTVTTISLRDVAVER